MIVDRDEMLAPEEYRSIASLSGKRKMPAGLLLPSSTKNRQ